MTRTKKSLIALAGLITLGIASIVVGSILTTRAIAESPIPPTVELPAKEPAKPAPAAPARPAQAPAPLAREDLIGLQRLDAEVDTNFGKLKIESLDWEKKRDAALAPSLKALQAKVKERDAVLERIASERSLAVACNRRFVTDPERGKDCTVAWDFGADGAVQFAEIKR